MIVTGWLAGYFGYVSRSLSDALIHFAYNIAMPALLFVTIGQEPARSLLAWRFLIAFGGGSLLCFAIVFIWSARRSGHDPRSQTMYGLSASMTNTGFVALPILQALYGPHAVLPAAIATVFVAVVMFPAAVLLLEFHGTSGRMQRGALAKHIVLNPLVLSTLLGAVWSIVGVPIPGPITAYLKIFADALTPCALFAIGLGLSLGGIRANLGSSLALAAVKLIIMPMVVYGVTLACRNSTRSTRSQRLSRRSADGQDGLHSRGRVQIRGAGWPDGIDNNASILFLVVSLYACPGSMPARSSELGAVDRGQQQKRPEPVSKPIMILAVVLSDYVRGFAGQPTGAVRASIDVDPLPWSGCGLG